MISSAFHLFVYNPLYNGLIFLITVVPRHDVGLAIIALTIIVRIILFPLARRMVKTQIKIKELASEIEAIKNTHKDNNVEQSRAILALYRHNDVHPLSGLGLTLLQFPVLLAIYLVFARGGLPIIHAQLLYSFVAAPHTITMVFLGLIDMGSTHSVVLAACAALTQYGYIRLTMGKRAASKKSNGSFSDDMARSMDVQMRFFLPGMIGVIGYSVCAAVPLYWTTANLFMIAQEYAAGRRFSGERVSA